MPIITCPNCGKERGVTAAHKERVGFKGLCRFCWQKSKRGTNSPWYKRGYWINKAGYKKVRIYPENFFYPMADGNGYVLENRLVMAQSLGRCLHKWESVHHKNGVKDDNKLENLELTNKNQHMRDHNKGYKDGFAKGLQDGKKGALKKVVEWLKEHRAKKHRWDVENKNNFDGVKLSEKNWQALLKEIS